MPLLIKANRMLNSIVFYPAWGVFVAFGPGVLSPSCSNLLLKPSAKTLLPGTHIPILHCILLCKNIKGKDTFWAYIYLGIYLPSLETRIVTALEWSPTGGYLAHLFPEVAIFTTPALVTPLAMVPGAVPGKDVGILAEVAWPRFRL